LFAPGGTPRGLVFKINSDVARVFADTAVRDTFLERQFMEPINSSPDTYADLIRSESQRWGEVIRQAKIKVE
jgi:tripartite-type tricarboxylate transporter receptor subunit TctC